MSVTTQAIRSIRSMIVTGELAPGDRLPPEQEFADRLGVSRGSLREAVRALSEINVLDVRRGDGTYVTSLAPTELLSGMVFAMELFQATGVDEVAEVRQLLLPPAAGLAARRVTKSQLAQLHAVVDRLEVATEPDDVARLHDQFASLVCDAAGNETLASILRSLQALGAHARRAWLGADPARRDLALAHQRLLLDALERGDSDMARSISLVQVEPHGRSIERQRTSSSTDRPQSRAPRPHRPVTARAARLSPTRSADGP